MVQQAERFRGCFGSFAQDARGTVALTFALAAIPVMMAVGSATDFARASQVKARLQAALDAGALAAAAARGMSDADRVRLAEQTFAQNFDSGSTAGLSATLSTALETRTVTMSADAELDTTFMRIAGIDVMDIASSVTINVPEEKKAEIALVLDYSGSMREFSGGKRKYVAMREAASDLVADLTNDGNSDTVRFGLVPFSHHVRATLPKRYVVGESGNGSWTGCTQDRKHPHNTRDTSPSRFDDDSKWGHEENPAHAHKGCAGYETRDLIVRPIGDDHQGVIDQLEDMRPHAWTHIALGFSFGWHLLSPNEPFGDVAPYDDETTMKVLDLLTDGRQTELGWGSDGDRSVRDGEDNLEALCTNAKDTGITVVTVAFDLRHQSTEDRLRDCASDADDYFFIAEDGDDLAAAFGEIKTQLRQALYISR